MCVCPIPLLLLADMQISAVVAMALLLGSGTACFITNCPPGGKRSSPSAQLGSVRTVRRRRRARPRTPKLAALEGSFVL